jgi:OmcA/MtrC family decaheme c-type cytochrome
MMRRLIVLLAVLTLAAPLMFYGCSGDDGSNGATGATGATGPPGPPGPGVVADETCALCHAAGKAEAVAAVHYLDADGNKITAGTVSVTVDSVDVDTTTDNAVVTVNFTFTATNAAGDDVTSSINLAKVTPATATNPARLTYIRFYLARLDPPAVANAPAEYFPYSIGNGGRLPAGLTYDNTTGIGSYTFTPDNTILSADWVDNTTTRVGIQISSFTGADLLAFTTDSNLSSPFTNYTYDFVPNGDPVTLNKNDVSYQACQACHNPNSGIAHGTRYDPRYCDICHNPSLESGGGNLAPLIHKIHTAQDNTGIPGFSAAEIGYPQAPNNCLTCHKGPAAADNTYSNWKNVPSIEACGACHTNVNFATGAGHVGGAQADGSCAGCHPATAIPQYHAAKEGAPPTPDNPVVATGLKVVEYAINSVTVDNTNAATIKFSILIDNALANLGDNVIAAPTGFTGGPSFLFAYTLPQGNVSAPADYNNLGRSAGQPLSSSIIGKTITAKDNTSYTVKVDNAFPAGAKMRAVALQGYFTQTNAIGTDNVARHTVSVQKAVTGDAVRRTVVKSGGYTADGTGAPQGCLECHEVFEGHGGNRVNNVQVCVMCHNPNLTTSGRTITADPINPDIVALFGSDPLAYPEDANDFKELIHGLHAREMRVNDFVDIRNRLDGVLLLGDEVTYPGNLSTCTKCHLNGTYANVASTNFLVTTTKITTGNANETVADINAARATVPNSTDLVNTPTSSACGYCHDTPTAVSHFGLQGGKIKTERGIATLTPPPLDPVNP